MKLSSLIKLTDQYYQLCKLAGVLEYPVKMHENISKYVTNVYCSKISEIFQGISLRLRKIRNTVPKGAKYAPIISAINNFIVNSDKIKTDCDSLKSSLGKTSGVIIKTSDMISSNIKLLDNTPLLGYQKFRDEIGLIVDFIENGCFFLQEIEFKVDFSDLSPHYLREHSDREDVSIHALISMIEKTMPGAASKPPFFDKLKVCIFFDMKSQIINIANVGGYDPVDNKLAFNFSSSLDQALNSFINLQDFDISKEVEDIDLTSAHELRHLVQNFLEWKTGNRKFNSKGQLCETDSSGKIRVDKLGNPILDRAVDYNWIGERELSESAESLIQDNLTISNTDNEEIKKHIREFLNAFNLPDSTVVNRALLIKEIKNLQNKVKSGSISRAEGNKKSKVIYNLKSLIDANFDPKNPDASYSQSQYLLSSIEYETWLADAIRKFIDKVKNSSLEYNKKSFDEFVGHSAITSNTNEFFAELYKIDNSRWRKAVINFWNEINNLMPLDYLKDALDNYRKFVTINNLKPKEYTNNLMLYVNTTSNTEKYRVPRQNDEYYFPILIEKLKSIDEVLANKLIRDTLVYAMGNLTSP